MPCCGGKAVVTEVQAIKEMPEYTITIKTGDEENAATDGPIFLKIFGENENETEELELEKRRLSAGSVENFRIRTVDVGKPKRIFIRHEDFDSGWFLVEISIKVQSFNVRFVANRWLSKNKNDKKTSVELFGSEKKPVEYSIEMNSAEEIVEPLESAVFFELVGTENRTSRIFLDPTRRKFSVQQNDVGKLKKFYLGYENVDDEKRWRPSKVKLFIGDQVYRFETRNSIDEDSKRIELTVVHQINYVISIKTMNKTGIFNGQRVEMNLYGAKDKIENISLNNSAVGNDRNLCQAENVDRFEIEAADLGLIKSVKLTFHENQNQEFLWFIENVTVDNGDVLFQFPGNCVLSNLFDNRTNSIVLLEENDSSQIDFRLILETRPMEFDSNLIFSLHDNEKISGQFVAKEVSSEGKTEIHFKSVDLDNIQKIVLGQDASGSRRSIFFNSVSLERNGTILQFSGNGWLNRNNRNQKDSIEFRVETRGKCLYKISVRTNDEVISGTDSAVFLTILGEENQTKRVQLISSTLGPVEKFSPGTTNCFDLLLDEVGKIQEIEIEIDGKGLMPSWRFDQIQIEKDQEVYSFECETMLDLSTMSIKLKPSIRKQTEERRNSTRSNNDEICYKVWVRLENPPIGEIPDEASLFLTIRGKEDSLPTQILQKTKKSKRISSNFSARDIGEICGITIGQGENKLSVSWFVVDVTIWRADEKQIFQIGRKIEENQSFDVSPCNRDVLYEIETTMGKEPFDGEVLLRIRGETGIINIPLSATESQNKPFQSKAVDRFTSRTDDVGRIERVHIVHEGTTEENPFHLQKFRITKGKDVYEFHANVRVVNEEQKILLYPVPNRREDFVESQLRKLRKSLKDEAMKKRRPPPKDFQPYVYNNLNPYFDTNDVDKAIHEPLDIHGGYYTRITALRIVEPWEAHEMDYGVYYEMSKHKKSRSSSAKRSSTRNTERSIDRHQGSTHLPDFPLVTARKPIEYDRVLTQSDVPKIRSFIQQHQATQANQRKAKDYERTLQDFYRMHLDELESHDETHREHLLQMYRSYLENTAGSKKAIRQLCSEIQETETN